MKTKITTSAAGFAKEVHTETTMHASAHEIWQILLRFSEYNAWNPLVKNISGEPQIGQRLSLEIHLPNNKPMRFTPKVTACEVDKKFSWLGNLGVPGLFDGEHIFEIHENADGTCKWVHREKFKGILLPLFHDILHVKTPKGFELMNEALKAKVEKG
jgi:hypothetical protein